MASMPVSVPPSAVPLGPLHSNYLYAKTIVANLAHRALLRRRRRREQVTADYDAGEWAQQKSARHWLLTPTLEAYADKQWLDRDIVAELEGRLWRLPASEYYRFRRHKLIEILSEYDCGVETIVELGSGTGSNLFSLATTDRWKHILGLELSPTGREVTRCVTERFDLDDRVEVDEIDLLDATSAGFARLQGAVVFTHYCLEQLPNHTETVFRNLAAVGIRRAILLEPSFELLSRASLRDQASRTYVIRQDYQRSIIGVGRKLESEGLIEIVAARRLDFVSSCRNPPTLLVWDLREAPAAR